MDLIAELRTEIWYKLTRDEALKTVCKGTVRLYNTWAEQDSPMPYLVHRTQEKPLLDGVITDIDYYLDIWDYDPSIARVLDIRSRIVALLDGSAFMFNSGAIARFKYFSGGDIPEGADGIQRHGTNDVQHYATQWKIRMDRTADIKAKELI